MRISFSRDVNLDDEEELLEEEVPKLLRLKRDETEEAHYDFDFRF